MSNTANMKPNGPGLETVGRDTYIYASCLSS